MELLHEISYSIMRIQEQNRPGKSAIFTKSNRAMSSCRKTWLQRCDVKFVSNYPSLNFDASVFYRFLHFPQKLLLQSLCYCGFPLVPLFNFLYINFCSL